MEQALFCQSQRGRMNIFSYLPDLIRAGERETEIRQLVTELWELEPAIKKAAGIFARAKALANEIHPGLIPEENFDVEWFQATLNKFGGEHLTVDGKYGSATHAAVERFQAANGIHVDGWVGPETIGKMFRLSQGK